MSDTTNVQQQAALALATRCARILRDRFKARRVIPFGSVVGHGTWHAGYLHQFYTGCERILERIAVTVDGSFPGGAFSHANLLAQMARELPGIRPAVLHETLWLRLQDYLAFRHFFRHAYGYTLEWAKLRPLVAGMSAIFADLHGQLITFLNYP